MARSAASTWPLMQGAAGGRSMFHGSTLASSASASGWRSCATCSGSAWPSRWWAAPPSGVAARRCSRSNPSRWRRRSCPLQDLLALKGGLPPDRLERLRRLADRVVGDLVRELTATLRPALTGTVVARPTRRRCGPLDLSRTVGRSLRTAASGRRLAAAGARPAGPPRGRETLADGKLTHVTSWPVVLSTWSGISPS
jgi:hypothetical protein